MSSNFLFQTVHETTNGCNTLDLQFVNSDIFTSPYVMPTTFSDHDLLCWNFHTAIPESNELSEPVYSPECFSSYNLASDQVKWDDISTFLEEELMKLDTNSSTQDQLLITC